MNSMSAAAHRRYADIFRDVEALVEDHSQIPLEQSISVY